jgi:hypothetical protein
MPSLRRKLSKDGCLNGHPRTKVIFLLRPAAAEYRHTVEPQPAVQSWPFWKTLRRGSRRSRAGPAFRPRSQCGPAAKKSKCFQVQGVIPNKPKLPLVLYRSPVRLSGKFDPAAVFEELFERNGWGDSWGNGIYDYAHYHSRIHARRCARTRPSPHGPLSGSEGARTCW